MRNRSHQNGNQRHGRNVQNIGNGNYVLFAVPNRYVSAVSSLISGNRTSDVTDVNTQTENGEGNWTTSGRQSQGGQQSRRSQRDVQTSGTGTIGEWNTDSIQKAVSGSTRLEKRILRFLASHPGQDLSAEKIAENNDVNVNNQFEVVDALGAFASRIRTQYKIQKPPFLKQFSGNRVQYMMPKEIARQISRQITS